MVADGYAPRARLLALSAARATAATAADEGKYSSLIPTSECMLQVVKRTGK